MPSRTTEGAGDAAAWSGVRVRWSDFIELYIYDQHTVLQAGQAAIKRFKRAAILEQNQPFKKYQSKPFS